MARLAAATRVLLRDSIGDDYASATATATATTPTFNNVVTFRN